MYTDFMSDINFIAKNLQNGFVYKTLFDEDLSNDSLHACIPEPNKVFDRPQREPKSIKTDNITSYKYNNYGFRCDDFDAEKSKLNYLFAGCSITYGEGLPVDYSWASLFNKFNQKSDFYNLAVPGIGIEEICLNIFKYVELFGPPEKLLVLMPNLERVRPAKKSKKSYEFFEDFFYINHYRFSEKRIKNLKNTEGYETVFDEIYSTEVLFIRAYRAIRSLEIFCNSHNIELHWSTWDQGFDSIISKIKEQGFTNYFSLTRDGKLKNSNLSFDKNNEAHRLYWDRGRDGNHPGIKPQHAIFQKFASASISHDK